MGTFDDINLERTESWVPPLAGVRRAPVVSDCACAGGGRDRVVDANAPRTDRRRRAHGLGGPGHARVPCRFGARRARQSDLPPLDALDPMLRGLMAELTGSPLLTKWLATGDLARQIAAVVDGTAAGSLPLQLLAPLRPTGAFSVVERGGRATIAPASYARYDAMTGAIAALDPAAAARAYRLLAPRLQEAHGELGEGSRTFDSALRDGLRRLAETPIPDGPVAVTARGGVYAFPDPRLEALTPAQKLLLRSGPDNARRVQAQLAAIIAALGTPAGATPHRHPSAVFTGV